MRFLLTFLFIVNLTTYAQHSDIIEDIQKYSVISHIDKETLNQKEKEFLQPGIKNKKFVFLGEADHFFEEKYTYRLKFIEYLLSQGFTHILDEMGVSDGEMVQKYLETGNEDFLKKVGLYGFKYGQDLSESKRSFVLSSKRYIRKLRVLKKKYPKLIYGGYDLDMMPGTTYLQLDNFFKKYSFSFTKRLEDLINSSKKDEGLQQVKSLESSYLEFIKIKPKLLRNIAKKELIHLELILRNFVSSVDLREKFKSDQDMFKVFEWREKQMFKNMISRSKLDPKNQKYILMGHNGHLTKTVKDYRDLDGKEQWYAIGSWVHDNYPNQSYAIWSLIGHGEHSGHGCDGGKTCYFSAPETTLEYDLLRFENEKTLLFSTQFKSFTANNKIIRTLVNGIEILSGPLSLQADAIYFIPEVSDMKP